MKTTSYLAALGAVVLWTAGASAQSPQTPQKEPGTTPAKDGSAAQKQNPEQPTTPNNGATNNDKDKKDTGDKGTGKNDTPNNGPADKNSPNNHDKKKGKHADHKPAQPGAGSDVPVPAPQGPRTGALEVSTRRVRGPRTPPPFAGGRDG